MGGFVNITSGVGQQSDSGGTVIQTADAGIVGVSGDMLIQTGTSTGGNTGTVAFSTGDAFVGQGGHITLAVGRGDSHDGGDIALSAGLTDAPFASGGGITLQAASHVYSQDEGVVGPIDILSGDAAGAGGGYINIQVGEGSGTLNGGAVSIAVGPTNGTLDGGSVFVAAGPSGHDNDGRQAGRRRVRHGWRLPDPVGRLHPAAHGHQHVNLVWKHGDPHGQRGQGRRVWPPRHPHWHVFIRQHGHRDHHDRHR